MKAIKVTKRNIGTIASNFRRESAEDENFVEGDIVITEFGNEDTFEVISQMYLDAHFTVGDTLKNDWFEIIPR